MSRAKKKTSAKKKTATAQRAAKKKAVVSAKPASKKKSAAKPAKAAKPASKTKAAKPAAKTKAAKPAAKKKTAVPSGGKPGATGFAGFPKDGLTFLAELAVNNDRDWFAANKERYERFVLQPALAFIVAMRPKLAAISSQFEAVDKKVGGSLMRIYRDTRFAADKSPYKTNIGIQFRHAGGKDVHAPGFYLHVEPGEAFLGCGMWRPDKGPLESVRNAIADTPEKWRNVLKDKAFAQHFELQGESLSRPPKGFDPQHPLIGDIKRKDHIAVCSVPAATLHEGALVDLVVDRFRAVAPYVQFLCDAVGATF